MRNRIKILVAMLLAVSLITLSACDISKKDEPNTPTTEELMASQYNDLTTAFGETCDVDEIFEYLIDVSKNAGYSVKFYNNDILLITRNVDTKPATTLHCTITGKDNNTEMQYLSVLMTVMDNVRSDNNLQIIITTEKSENKIYKYVDDSENFINLYYNEDDITFVNENATCRQYKISKNISWTSPRFTKAYKLSIKHLRGGKITDLSEGHPNPILQLNSIMSKWNTQGYVYDIASFTGGTSGGRYGNEASMTVVIPENDAEKFLSKVEKQQNSFNKKYGDDEPAYEFTVEETSLPDRVLDSKSGNSIISLLYILITGDYTPDDEESDDTLAYSNIGKVRITDNQAVIRVNLYSMNEELMDEMVDAVDTLAEISNFRCRMTGSYPYIRLDENGELSKGLMENYPADPKYISNFGVTSCNIVAKHYPKIETVSIGINFNQWSKPAKMLMDFLK